MFKRYSATEVQLLLIECPTSTSQYFIDEFLRLIETKQFPYTFVEGWNPARHASKKSGKIP